MRSDGECPSFPIQAWNHPCIPGFYVTVSTSDAEYTKISLHTSILGFSGGTNPCPNDTSGYSYEAANGFIWKLGQMWAEDLWTGSTSLDLRAIHNKSSSNENISFRAYCYYYDAALGYTVMVNYEDIVLSVAPNDPLVCPSSLGVLATLDIYGDGYVEWE
jgi:hypothetical protein